MTPRQLEILQHALGVDQYGRTKERAIMSDKDEVLKRKPFAVECEDGHIQEEIRSWIYGEESTTIYYLGENWADARSRLPNAPAPLERVNNTMQCLGCYDTDTDTFLAHKGESNHVGQG